MVFSVRLLWAPSSVWFSLWTRGLEGVSLSFQVLLLGVLVLFLRLVGHLLMGWALGAALVESVAHAALVFGLASVAGVLMVAALRWQGHSVPERVGQVVALLSTSPVVLAGVLVWIPSLNPWRAYMLLLALAWGASLMLRGLWELAGVAPRATLLAALMGSGLWVLGVSLLTQVLTLVFVT